MKDTHEFAELEAFAKDLPKTVHGYVYQKMVGSGGFSRIFLCHSPDYDIDFCAKVMPISARSANMAEQETDLSILMLLDHPNILHVYDQFQEATTYHIILEYCPNGSLSQVIKKGLLNSHDILVAYMKQITEALCYCHSQNIVHRDIKPQNILIDVSGRPKIIDFGISMRVNPGDEVEVFSGSPPYLAPEVLIEQSHDPYKADVWSLGVTFYCMAVGHLPWPDNQEKVMHEAIEQAQFVIPASVPQDVNELICAMLAVEAADRPSLKELLDFDIFQNSDGVCNLFAEEKGHSFKMQEPGSESASRFYVTRESTGRDGMIRRKTWKSTLSSFEELFV